MANKARDGLKALKAAVALVEAAMYDAGESEEFNNVTRQRIHYLLSEDIQVSVTLDPFFYDNANYHPAAGTRNPIRLEFGLQGNGWVQKGVGRVDPVLSVQTMLRRHPAYFLGSVGLRNDRGNDLLVYTLGQLNANDRYRGNVMQNARARATRVMRQQFRQGVQRRAATVIQSHRRGQLARREYWNRMHARYAPGGAGAQAAKARFNAAARRNRGANNETNRKAKRPRR